MNYTLSFEYVIFKTVIRSAQCERIIVTPFTGLPVFIYNCTAMARTLSNHILGAGSLVMDLLMFGTLLSSIV